MVTGHEAAPRSRRGRRGSGRDDTPLRAVFHGQLRQGQAVHQQPQGLNLRQHDWNFVNGRKLISRVKAGDQVMCLDTEGDKPFLAACAGEQSQKWGAHRNRAPGEPPGTRSARATPPWRTTAVMRWKHPTP